MLQDIFPHKFKVEYSLKNPQENDYVLIFKGNRVLLDSGGELYRIPFYHRISESFSLSVENLIYLFSVDDARFFLANPSGDDEAELDGFVFQSSDNFRKFNPSWLAFAGITGCQLARWYEYNHFCGKCGTTMSQSEKERALYCKSCGNILYPKISPVVIVAVRNGDKLLLTRYRDRPFTNYALIAGYVEIGETLEHTVQREVMEEAGLRVKNITYYKSQPWAFTDTLLSGFFADLDGDDQITLDDEELAEALWVNRSEIEPQNLEISLTAEMMEAFRRGDF